MSATAAARRLPPEIDLSRETLSWPHGPPELTPPRRTTTACAPGEPEDARTGDECGIILQMLYRTVQPDLSEGKQNEFDDAADRLTSLLDETHMTWERCA
jgi:hypothetical protein